MSAPPPNNAKFNESVPPEYYQEVPYSNPTMQQAQPLRIVNPMIAVPGDLPTACSCPYCHQSIVTRVGKENGLLVWLSVGGLCIFGCFLGCCLIPFCIDAFKDTTHYCPNCNTLIARNKKL